MDSDTAPVIAAVERLGPHAIIGGIKQDELSLAVLPQGKTLVDMYPYLDRLREAPRRIVAGALATTIASFVDYVNRFKTGDTAIFAIDDATKPSLLAVIDFHGQGDNAAPRFGFHSVRYEFPISDQIRAWSAVSGSPLSHSDMATFLADRQYDIANPPIDWMQVAPETIKLLTQLLNLDADSGEVDDAAPDEPGADDGEDRHIPRSALYKLRKIRFGSAQRLIQLARTVEVSVNAKSTEGYNPKTGERTVAFTEEHQTTDKDGRKVIVPDAFLLRAPVFEGETSQLVPVRLQYRRKGAELSWFMTLVEWKRVIRLAVKAEAERVKAATTAPVYYGKPTT